MSTEIDPTKVRLDVRDVNPIRCDIATGSDAYVEYKNGKKTLKQNPGITIKTDHEKIAEIIEMLSKSPVHTEPAPEEPTIDPDKLRLNEAIGKVVAMGPQLIQTESSDVAGHRINALFEGLGDPDRRERTIRRVEVLYEKQVITAIRE